jgi:hypothetical protein
MTDRLQLQQLATDLANLAHIIGDGENKAFQDKGRELEIISQELKNEANKGIHFVEPETVGTAKP